MKAQSIVYTSNTGFTREYALMLGEKTNLPVYSLQESSGKIARDSSVVYLGWLMAGKVQGYADAAKQYSVEGVCGVGMGSTGSQIEDVRKNNNIPDSMPVFTLQGGFDMNKLRGVYKMMMQVMKKTVGKKLAEKADRTPDEEEMLDLLLHGGSRVSEENLAAVLEWMGM
ncbi:MAG: hypothetical protein ACI4LN_04355 [Anaerovoracaceae bacterium]